jgi:hypothetical protein
VTVGALLTGAIALLQVDELPSWLAWCPPWLAAVLASILGAGVLAVDRWSARRHAEADREQQAVDLLRAHLGRQETFPRIGEPPATALALRVHPAIDAPSPTATPASPDIGVTSALRLWFVSCARRRGRSRGALDPDLPLFVERDKFEEFCDRMRQARTSGGFLLLVGDSSVGKTRLLYEAARTVLPDFAILSPDLGDGHLVNTIAAATFPLPKLIVWLDELQRFLPGPYLTPGSTPITAAAIRQLLDTPTPVVIVGTLWRTYAATLRAIDPDPTTAMQRPRYPGAVDILTDQRLHETPLDTFSDLERTTAVRLAAQDQRLAKAVADRNYNVTEALAGAREVIHRYERATEEQKAIIHAAVDARRLGIHAPLTEQLLAAAARGYLDAVHPDDTWFAPALAELTSRSRPQDRATAPLLPVPSTDRATVLGYTVTDYLLQRLTWQRRTIRLSDGAWQALSTQISDLGDLRRLADSASNRLLYRYAEHLYRQLADAGDLVAAARLGSLLVEQGRVDEAIERFEALADAGAESAASDLANLPVEQGRAEDLWVRADAGDKSAAWKLIMLAYQGRFDEIIDQSRIKQVPWVLAFQGHAEEAFEILRARANSGDRSADKQLDDLLAHSCDPRLGHILDVRKLRAKVDGDYAPAWLVRLLIYQGRFGRVRALADAGHEHAAQQLAYVLAALGRIDELRDRAAAGDRFADEQLPWVLAHRGRVDEAIEILRARITEVELVMAGCESS